MDKHHTTKKSRRGFLITLLSGSEPSVSKPEMIKMLTPEGKVVEVEKSILIKATKNKKATNKEIYEWMKNPSKNNI